jgi:uncharacterized SAM-binding protein YcdF (DUF218 family)
LFVHLAKLGWALITPSTALSLLVLGGVVAGLLGWRHGTRLSLLAALLVLAAGLSPLGHWLMGSLENRFPPLREVPPGITGVIVLGGLVDDAVSEARGQLAVNEAGERLLGFVSLAKSLPQARLVISGGSGPYSAASLPEADLLAAAAADLGVAPARLEIERRSRTTHENAAMSRALLRPAPDERWLLVTSAFHMPRAMGSFRQAGFHVVAWPVDFRTAGVVQTPGGFGDVSSGLRRVDAATREWVGLLAYWLTGRSSALLPRLAMPPA